MTQILVTMYHIKKLIGKTLGLKEGSIRFVSPNGCALAAETGGDQGQDTGHLGQTSGGDGWPNSDGAEKPLRGHPDEGRGE